MVRVEFYPYNLYVFDGNLKDFSLFLNLADLKYFNYHGVSFAYCY